MQSVPAVGARVVQTEVRVGNTQTRLGSRGSRANDSSNKRSICISPSVRCPFSQVFTLLYHPQVSQGLNENARSLLKHGNRPIFVKN